MPLTRCPVDLLASAITIIAAKGKKSNAFSQIDPSPTAFAPRMFQPAQSAISPSSSAIAR